MLQQLLANKTATYYMSGIGLASATQRAVMEVSVTGKSCSIAAMDTGHGIFVTQQQRSSTRLQRHRKPIRNPFYSLRLALRCWIA